VDSSAAIAEASPTPLATALRTGVSAQATVEQTIAADDPRQHKPSKLRLLLPRGYASVSSVGARTSGPRPLRVSYESPPRCLLAGGCERVAEPCTRPLRTINGDAAAPASCAPVCPNRNAILVACSRSSSSRDSHFARMMAGRHSAPQDLSSDGGRSRMGLGR
jgi:hypothetical protein